jgi:diguanylate cyclase (GGDEF)-like protein
MLDLDGFKSVNDTLGHKAGDDLLRITADRLRGIVRRGDTVARFGGDEFVLLLEDVTGATETVELVEHLLNAVRQPTTVAGRELVSEASIGIALTDEEPRTVDELLRYADTAMYLAKQEGGSHYRVFETAMQTALAERSALEADLPGAAERGELRVFYQPILDLASQKVRGFEALVRWMHPTRGLLLLEAFVPLAEQSGVIHEIDTRVLNESTAEASRWQSQSPDFAQVAVHVNLSPLQLDEPDLLETVAEALSASGLAPHPLTLELLESSVVDDLELAKARLTELKALGVRMAVDDFGTGYSSLSHLRTLPIDELKIDRSFIAAMESSGQARTLVHSLIQLAAALGIDTVAEGIEDSEQLLWLRNENCLQGQ